MGFDYETLDPVEETEFNNRKLMIIGGVEVNQTDYGLQGLQGYDGCLTGGFIFHLCLPNFDSFIQKFLQ